MARRFPWTLCAVVFLSVGGCAAGDRAAEGGGADPSLRGYWAFDEGAGEVAANAVAGGNPGRVPPGLKWVEGRRGKALLFNGKDFVTVRHYADLNAPAYTLAAWTKLKNTGDHHYLFWKAGPEFPEAENSRRYDLWTDVDGTANGIMHDEKGGEERLSGGPSLADDRWHHVALTYDGRRLCLYVDGKAQASAEPAAPLAKNTHDLWIGGRPSEVVATGIIDEVRFYTRALSPTEVAALAAAP